MKSRIILTIIALLSVSCGIWRESPAEIESKDEQETPTRRVPGVYVHTGPEFSRLSLLEPLIEQYGSGEAGGSVHLFTSVTEIDSPPHGSIILTIGSDVGIIRPLSRLAENRNDIRCISLFSLADPVLLEYFSELVMDIALDDNLLTPESETRGIPISDEDLSLLILALIQFTDFRDWNLSRQEQLSRKVAAAFHTAGRKGPPPGWTIVPYIDPESGIRSRNHLTLELTETN